MNRERFAMVKKLFLEVVDLSEEERNARLDEACREDPDLRSEVEPYLAREGIPLKVLESGAIISFDAEDLMVGTTISHYKIVEKLGEGGMGVVYRAEDTRLRRTVALKFLAPDLVRTEEARRRFVHEAQTAAALDSPNISPVYEIDEHEGRLFIVL